VVGGKRRHAVLAVRVDVVGSSCSREVQVLVRDLAAVLALDLRCSGSKEVDGART
jgi:hypothetical protein